MLNLTVSNRTNLSSLPRVIALRGPSTSGFIAAAMVPFLLRTTKVMRGLRGCAEIIDVPVRKLVVGLLIAGGVGLAAADVAYSPPLGGMTISVPAGQTRAFSMPLLHFPSGAGAVVDRVAGVGATHLDIAAANWTPAAFSQATNPYYLRLTSGASAGRTLMVSSTANTPSRLFVSSDGVDLNLGAGPAAGDGYELVLADTLSSLFGTSTLQAGPDANAADNVLIWANTVWVNYYYNNVNNRWQRSTDTVASPSRDNFVLRPDRGFMITRRANSTLNMYVTGRVPAAAGRPVHSRPGTSFLSLAVPTDITIGDLALHTRLAGWKTAADAAASSAADRLQVWSNTTWTIYYLNNSGSWQRSTDIATSPSRNGVIIPAGRPIMISRVEAGSGADTLVSFPINYTLAN